jgi:hypothetical protein
LLKKAKHEREFANAARRLGNRHKDYFNLEEQHEEDLEAAFAERKDFESQISTLNNELSQCKGHLTTVNTKILDRETQLASALKAKEELESKLEATTQRADENALNLGELIVAGEHSTMIGRTPAAPVSNVARWWYYLKTPRSGLLHIMRTRFGLESSPSEVSSMDPSLRVFCEDTVAVVLAGCLWLAAGVAHPSLLFRGRSRSLGIFGLDTKLLLRALCLVNISPAHPNVSP